MYDGHKSHVGLNWVELAEKNNIILLCLPPHTTHRLQPLDVGCFGPLQTAWFNRCDAILAETGKPMELRDVVKEYWTARNIAFKEDTILQAWRKSGIRPLNPNIFTEADFAPSIASSTQVQLPRSFPRRLPRAPDASSDDVVFDAEEISRMREEREKEIGVGGDSERSDDSELDSDFDFEPSDDSDSPSEDEEGAGNNQRTSFPSTSMSAFSTPGSSSIGF